MLSAIIFDVDGTLAETEELHRQAFNDTFREHRLDWTWDAPLYRDLLRVTGGKERMLHFARQERPAALAAVEPMIARLHAAKNARYAALMAGGALALRPGIRRLLDECGARGIRLAIATTTSRENLDALLQATLRGTPPVAFAALVTGEDVHRKKPDPEAYHLALRRLALPAEACIAVEDSLNGLLAASAAGLRTIVTPGVYTDHERFEQAWAVVSDLGEPGRGYRHLGGVGAGDRLVDLATIERWLALR